MNNPDYEIRNGFSGMMRNVALRLCDIIERVDSIRAIIGMCQEHELYRKSDYFLFLRRNYVKTPFTPDIFNPKKHFIEGFGEVKLGFSYDCKSPEMFLKRSIHEGIFKWTVRVSYERNSSFSLGVQFIHSVISIPDLQDDLSSIAYSLQDDPAPFISCAGSRWFEFNRHDSSYHSDPRPHTWSSQLVSHEIGVEDNSFVTAEVNMGDGKLYFFVNKKKMPGHISDISGPLYFYISSTDTGSHFTSISLRRLDTPTAQVVSPPPPPPPPPSPPRPNRRRNPRLDPRENFDDDMEPGPDYYYDDD